MKEVAAWLIVWLVLLGGWFLILNQGGEWSFERSPNSGICYEIRTEGWVIGMTQGMSPVDDKWCEGGE